MRSLNVTSRAWIRQKQAIVSTINIYCNNGIKIDLKIFIWNKKPWIVQDISWEILVIFRATQNESERAHGREILSPVLRDFKQRDISETNDLFDMAYETKNVSFRPKNWKPWCTGTVMTLFDGLFLSQFKRNSFEISRQFEYHFEKFRNRFWKQKSSLVSKLQCFL